MCFGNVECGEIMLVGFDFGFGCNCEVQVGEDFGEFVYYLVDWMDCVCWYCIYGECYVECFVGKVCVECGVFECGFVFGDIVGDGFVQVLDDWVLYQVFVWCYFVECFQQCGDCVLFVECFDLVCFQCVEVGCCGDCCQYVFVYLFEIGGYCFKILILLFLCRWGFICVIVSNCYWCCGF